MLTIKPAILLFLNIIVIAIILVLMVSNVHAQVDGSCWELKSDLKHSHRYYCAAVNDSPFTGVIDQNRLFRQLKAFRPVPYSIISQRGADQNRNSGNSRLERFEKHGLPIGALLGAAGVIGSGVVTAGVSAAVPIVFPAIRKWFAEASPPLWEASPQLLSDTTITMEPRSSAGFWFYAEKKGMMGDFKILPMEMSVVEKRISELSPAEKLEHFVYTDGWGDPGAMIAYTGTAGIRQPLPVCSDGYLTQSDSLIQSGNIVQSGYLIQSDNIHRAQYAARRMNLAESERYLPPNESQSASQNLAHEYYIKTTGTSRP